MTDVVSLTDADGASVQGRALALPADEALRLTLPAGRKLDRAVLTLFAADDSRAVPEGIVLATDVGAFPPPAGQAVRWVAARWPGERAITAVRLDAVAKEKAGARLKMLSGGVWLPLSPVDVVRLNTEQGFPAVAASQLMAELLVENVIDGKPTGVLVPGALPVTALSVGVTRQPCRLAIAIADDPPFFTHSGPLSTVPVAVDGLARAVNRYLADNPQAGEVPIVVTASAAAGVIVESFAASLRALPSPPDRGPGTTGAAGRVLPARAERTLVAPSLLPYGRGQWCSASHITAQAFAALPEGAALSSLSLVLRAVGGRCTGEIAVHADAHGRPADRALPGGTVPFTAEPAAETAGSGGAGAPSTDVQLPQPLRPAGGRWWAVCRLNGGEAIWSAGPDAPAEAGPALRQVDGGPWLEAPATAGNGWLQAWVRVVDGLPASG